MVGVGRFADLASLEKVFEEAVRIAPERIDFEGASRQNPGPQDLQSAFR